MNGLEFCPDTVRMQDVSVRATSSRLFISERPMYFNCRYGNPERARTGGHDVVGF
ncbi:MAG: hypothetical protein ACYC99_10620 [Candidatus Geothermincolia bacterium]